MTRKWSIYKMRGTTAIGSMYMETCMIKLVIEKKTFVHFKSIKETKYKLNDTFIQIIQHLHNK